MEPKPNPEAEKPGFLKRLQNRLLSLCGCQTDADEGLDGARFTQAYLLKKEKKRNDRLREKLDQEYLQKNLQQYREELEKIIGSKVSPEEWNRLKALNPAAFVVHIVAKIRDNTLPLTEKEKSKALHYLGLIRQIVGLRAEMQDSLNVEPYYYLIAATANYYQIFGFLYVLIENLHQLVDEKVKTQTIGYLKERLHREGPGQELGELRQAFEQLDERTKEEILGPQMDLFLRQLFIDVGLKVTSEIKTWARSNLDRSSEGSGEKKALTDGSQEKTPPVSLEIKDIYEIVSKFKQLQEKLEPSRLREDVIACIHSKE